MGVGCGGGRGLDGGEGAGVEVGAEVSSDLLVCLIEEEKAGDFREGHALSLPWC
jgi:hypothetical protein